MREEKKDGKKWEENEMTGRQKEKDTKIIDYRPTYLVSGKRSSNSCIIHLTIQQY